MVPPGSNSIIVWFLFVLAQRRQLGSDDSSPPSPALTSVPGAPLPPSFVDLFTFLVNLGDRRAMQSVVSRALLFPRSPLGPQGTFSFLKGGRVDDPVGVD